MIRVKVSRGKGDIEAPPIQDNLIVTESMAVSRAKRFLDDPNQGNYYTIIARSFQSPYKKVLPNQWISLQEGRLGLDNVVKVVSHDINLSKEGIWSDISTIEYIDNER